MQTETLVFRPDRRHLYVAVPAGAALTILLGFLIRDPWDYLIVGALAFFVFAHSYEVVRGRTVVGPDGIRQGIHKSEVFVPWEKVRRLEVVPSAVAWRVRVFHGSAEEKLILLAPRFGLLRQPIGRDDAVAEIVRLAAPHSPPVTRGSYWTRVFWLALFSLGALWVAGKVIWPD